MAITQFQDPTPVLQRLAASLGGGQTGATYSPFGQGGQSLQQMLSSNAPAASSTPGSEWSLPTPPSFTPPAQPPQIDLGGILDLIKPQPAPTPSPAPAPTPQPASGPPGITWTDSTGRPMGPGSPGWVPGMNNIGNGNPVGRGW